MLNNKYRWLLNGVVNRCHKTARYRHCNSNYILRCSGPTTSAASNTCTSDFKPTRPSIRSFSDQSSDDRGVPIIKYPSSERYKTSSGSFLKWSLIAVAGIVPGLVLLYVSQKQDDDYEWVVEHPKYKFYSLESPKKIKKPKPKRPPPAVNEYKKYTAPPVLQNVHIPEHVPYLIIGSGTAGFSAVRAIKGIDIDAKVLVIGEEQHLPYMRPPLSKELWNLADRRVANSLTYVGWNGKEKSLFYEKNEFFCDPEKLQERPHGGISLVRGRKVEKLDPSRHEVTLDDGTIVKFDKCLVATGGRPKTLNSIEEGGDEVSKRVTLYRTADDFLNLESLACQRDKSIAIIGGGFLGSELACSLARRGKENGVKVHQLFPEEGVLGKVLPQYLSSWTTSKVLNDGVNVLKNVSVKSSAFENGKVRLHLNDGQTVDVDHVVVAVGIEPHVSLAKNAGLEVDPHNGGFLCDSELRARTDVWVAGDCCSFYDPKLGRRRVEHQDHAIVSGRLAGQNMAGAGKAYEHQSFFWSDLGPDVGFEAIGIIDSSLPTVGVFAKANLNSEDKIKNESTTVADLKDNDDYSKGIVFYLRDKQIVGLLLWNLYNRISIARRILKDNTEYDDLNELAKLFNIHDAPPVSADLLKTETDLVNSDSNSSTKT